MDTSLSLEPWLIVLAIAGLLLIAFLWALGRGNRARSEVARNQTLLAEAQTGSVALRDAVELAARERATAETRAQLADQDATRLRDQLAALQQT